MLRQTAYDDLTWMIWIWYSSTSVINFIQTWLVLIRKLFRKITVSNHYLIRSRPVLPLHLESNNWMILVSPAPHTKQPHTSRRIWNMEHSNEALVQTIFFCKWVIFSGSSRYSGVYIGALVSGAGVVEPRRNPSSLGPLCAQPRWWAWGRRDQDPRWS